MEFSYVATAVRRYWWVVVLCVAIGLVPVIARRSSTQEYVARAVLLVSPPSDSRVQVTFNNDPDRYVIGQLSVLRSSSLADQVAKKIEGETAVSIASAI